MSELITVMMPAYNAIEYVDTALLSLIAQTNGDFEVLAYDDHSDDGTYERLQFWAERDSRLRVARPFDEHGHYTDICNQLLEDAAGQFVARMDADDVSLPDRLALQLDFLRQKKAGTLLGGMAMAIIQAEGCRISDTSPWESTIIKPVASRTVPVNEAIRTHHRLVHGTLFGRRDELLEIGGYLDMFPIEDWELSLRVDDAGGDVYILPDIIYLRRIHAQNSSKGHPKKQEVFEYIRDRYQLQLDSLPRTRPAGL